MITCPACATGCPDGSRFCLSCGALLDAGRALSTERRTITVLFADLVGFTRLSERLDAEDVDRLLREYGLLARSSIEAYGGVVEKYIGDAVAGVFGVPRLHEDDAERAVRAALRLIDRLPAVTIADEHVEVRVGINTGPALVRLDVVPGSGQSFIVGDAVNTAARLQQHADPMRVVIGEATHRMVRGAIDCEQLGPVAAKGRTRTLRPWLVNAPIARSGVDLRRAFASPFVGREVELGILEGSFEKTVASREPQFALVTGEAGIGKSRLVFELARRLEEAPESLTTWRQGRALPHGDGAAFWSLSEIVRQHAGVREDDDPPTVESKLRRAVPSAPDAGWILERTRPLLGLEASPASQEENLSAWQRLLELMAAQGPAVLVFDDMQWAHPGTLAFLEHLAAHLSGVPVLVLVVARPELREVRPGLAAGGRWVTIDLHPLSAGETRRLVGLMAGASAAQIEPSVAERCGGNPFFTEELVRLLLERRSVPTESTARPREDAETALPDSLVALVAARLDALDPELKGVLADAAVVGQTFWPGAVAAVGGIDEGEVEGRIETLAQREFVRRVATTSLAGEVECSFWHGLTREVAYAALPRGVKAAKHAAVAHWIESGEQKEAAAEVLAHHYERALELAEAAGESELAGRLTEPAVCALRAAGDRAMPLDVAVAERHYRHALRLCPEDSPLRPHLLVGHGESLLQRGDLAEAQVALERGLLGLHAAGDVRAEAVATGSLATMLWVRSDARALEIIARAAALLDDEPPSADQVKVLADWGAMCAASYDSDTALTVTSRALELCRELGLPVSVRALGWRGLARCHFGDAGGLDDMRRALVLAKRQGLGRYSGMLYTNLSDELLTFRGTQAAWRSRRKGIEFAGGRGDRMSVIGLQAEELEDLCWAGRWDAALTRAAEIEGPLAAADQVLDLAIVRSTVARILTARGHAGGPEVRAYVEWARAREFPDLANDIDRLDALASVHDALGEQAQALRLLRRIAEARESIRSCPHYGLRLPAELRTAVALGDPRSCPEVGGQDDREQDLRRPRTRPAGRARVRARGPAGPGGRALR